MRQGRLCTSSVCSILLQPPCRLVQGAAICLVCFSFLSPPHSSRWVGASRLALARPQLPLLNGSTGIRRSEARLAHAPHALSGRCLAYWLFHGAVWIYKQRLGSAGAAPTPLPHPFPLSPTRRLLDLVARVSVRSFFFCLSWCTRQSLRCWGWAIRSVAGWSLSTTRPSPWIGAVPRPWTSISFRCLPPPRLWTFLIASFPSAFPFLTLLVWVCLLRDHSRGIHRSLTTSLLVTLFFSTSRFYQHSRVRARRFTHSTHHE